MMTVRLFVLVFTFAFAIDASAQARRAGLKSAAGPAASSSSQKTAAAKPRATSSSGGGSSSKAAQPVKVSGSGIKCLEKASVDLLKGACNFLIPGTLGTDNKLWRSKPLLCVFQTFQDDPQNNPSPGYIFLQQMYGISRLQAKSNIITIQASRFARTGMYGYVDMIIREVEKGRKSELRESVINDAIVEKILDTLDVPGDIEKVITSRSRENVDIVSLVSAAQMDACMEAADTVKIQCNAFGVDIERQIEASCVEFQTAFQMMGANRKVDLDNYLGQILEVLARERASGMIDINKLRQEVAAIKSKKGIKEDEEAIAQAMENALATAEAEAAEASE